MSIPDFAALKTAIANWAARPDLGGVLGTFVSLTETVFNEGERDDSGGFRIEPLRVRDMEKTATITVTNGEGDLPAGFMAAISVTDPSDITRNIEYASADWLADAYPTGQNASYPAFYTIIGNKLICPISVRLTYYERIPTLTSAEDATNWLLAKAPNAYLFGGLMQYSIYNKNPESVVYYRSLMANALGGLGLSDLNARAGNMTKRASGQAF